jgi:hypothetical protein
MVKFGSPGAPTGPSALPSRTDIVSVTTHVRKVPKATCSAIAPNLRTDQLELLDRGSGAEFLICAQNRTETSQLFWRAACVLSLHLNPSETSNASAHIGPDRIFGFTAYCDGTNLPSQYAPWTAFKTIDLTRGTTQAGVNVTECLDDIEKHGFHLTDAHVRITERAVT